jgi:hypothetical protein
MADRIDDEANDLMDQFEFRKRIFYESLRAVVETTTFDVPKLLESSG